MKTRFYLFLLSALFAAVVFTSFRDDDWLTALLAKLDNYRNQYPQEKVHIHSDKPYYSIGDDIWLKAYVVNNENHELSTLSKILYIDLLDERDSVHKTVVLPLVNGLGNGSIKLTDSIVNAGNYRLKAYTRWMQNFSSDFIFSKNILIGDARTPTSMRASAAFSVKSQQVYAELSFFTLAANTPMAAKALSYQIYNGQTLLASDKGTTDNNGKLLITAPLTDGTKADDIHLETTITVAPFTEVKRSFSFNKQGKIDVQFFPEGGWLVNSLRSKVGFKASVAGGKGVDVKGVIVDQKGKEVTTFDSQHAGMGVFALQPLAGNTYTAIIKDAAGNDLRYALPAATNEGCVMAVNHTGKDSLTISLAASKSLQQKEYGLVAQQNGVMRYAGKIKFDAPIVSTRLAEKRLNTGIVQFTLLAPDGTPVAERLSFINHNDQLQISISTPKAQYKPHEKVEMNIDAKDDTGSPQQANFSVSVIDENKVDVAGGAEEGILANFMLTSDLKGYIENPDYYFDKPNADKARHLDNLLLTQGWRRFKWIDISSGKQAPPVFKAQKSLDVSGTITTLTNKPVPFGKITLLATTAQGPLLIDTVADKDGRFVIDQIDLTGDVKVTVKAKGAKDQNNVKIVLDKPVKPIYQHDIINSDELTTESLINYLNNTQKRFELLDDGILNKTVMLKQVDVKDKRINNKKTIQGSFKAITGEADLVITQEDLKWRQNVLQTLYGKAGIQIKEPYVYMVRGPRSIIGPKRPMEIRVNGSPVDPGFLLQLSTNDVEGVEVIMSSYNLVTYGEPGSSGVIEVTLKNQYSLQRAAVPTFNVNQQMVNGYTAYREFYSPAYDAEQSSTKAADLRSTIYWNPNFVTDENGKARVTYFTADQPGNYRALVEGIDIDGRLASKVYTFSVK